MIPLPIDAHIPKILSLINPHDLTTPSFILTASPGSGKTTRLPAALLQLVQKTAAFSDKKIIVLVPKRIAAVTAAKRIAHEHNWSLGREVGYEVRFESRSTFETRLVFMTTGYFLNKIGNSDFVKNLGWIVFDEFHERTADMDLALAWARENKILNQNLQIIVMSATLDVQPLSSYLETKNIFELMSPPHPLEIIYSSKSQNLFLNDSAWLQLKETILEAIQKTKGHILVFLPGVSEIHRSKMYLEKNFKNLPFLIFHGQLSLDEQDDILNQLQNVTQRKVILSTNIAESSLTLPNTFCVIDSGLERRQTGASKLGFQSLETVRISKFSAIQRAGRSNRQSAGTTYRLWHQTDERSMAESIRPEILDCAFLDLALKAIQLFSCDPIQIEWLTAPTKNSLQSAITELKKFNLVDEQWRLTQYGLTILELPLSVKDAAVFIYLASHGFHNEISLYFANLEDAPRRLVQKMGAMPPQPQNSESDLDVLTRPPAQFSSKKKFEQLKSISFSVSKNGFNLLNSKLILQLKSAQDFSHALSFVLFEIYRNRLFKRQSKFDLSYAGFGAELNPMSSVSKNEKFYIALRGFQNTSGFDQIEYALEVPTQQLLIAANDEISNENIIEFQESNSQFVQITKKRLGAITLSESPPQPLPASEASQMWKELLEKQFSALLRKNPSYIWIHNRLHFISKNPDLKSGFPDELKKELEFPIPDWPQELKSELTQIISLSCTSLQEAIQFDMQTAIRYHQRDSIRALTHLIIELQSTFTLPNGRICTIDYADEKAPMISSKLQDFFGLKANPTILDGRIKIVCELLAPNQRPTQVTSDIVSFWKVGYFELKKELKGRYPKHDWPDDPANFISISKKKSFNVNN